MDPYGTLSGHSLTYAHSGIPSDQDHERVSAFTKTHYNILLETKETSLKGHNWGRIDVQGPNLAFLVGKQPAFTLPLAKIANSNMAGKTEVSLEIAPPPPAVPQSTSGGKVRVRAVDELVEMRFHVPGQAAKDDDDSGSDVEGEEKVSAAQAFHDMIKERADIGEGGAGEGVVVFNEVLVLTPRYAYEIYRSIQGECTDHSQPSALSARRGRYDVDMFLTNFRLRGKTYDYKILYTSVTRLFLLPKADEIHTQLVVSWIAPDRRREPFHLTAWPTAPLFCRSASTLRSDRVRLDTRTWLCSSRGTRRWTQSSTWTSESKSILCV